MKKIDLACIVEDDPIHLFLTQKYLKLTELVENILVCNNGKEAYEVLNAIITAKKKLPELILLDLNMPVWDGWQFLDAFTQIPIEEQVTIYILTSSNSPQDLKRAERYNLSKNYIVKPIDLKSLKEILSEVGTNDEDE